MRVFIIVLFLTYSITSKAYTPIDPNCLVKRVGVNIGDYGIAAKYAIVDICNNKITETIKFSSKKIDFKKAIRDKGRNIMPLGNVYQAVVESSAIIDELGVDCNKIKCMTIVTGEILNVTNKNIIFKYINDVNKLVIRELDAISDSELRFKGLFANDYFHKRDISKLTVLDMRNSNFMVTKFVKGKIISANIDYSPEKLMHELIINFPLNLKQINYAKNIASREFDIRKNLIENTIIKAPLNSRIYAMGEIFDDIMVKNINSYNKIINRVNVINFITRLSGFDPMNYENGLFENPKLSIVNLIFLNAAMKSFRIEKIKIIRNTSNIDGMLITNNFWNSFGLKEKINLH